MSGYLGIFASGARIAAMLAAMLVLATSTTADAGPSQTAKPPAADSPPLRSGGESAAGGRLPGSFADLIDRVKPAVVNIATTQTAGAAQGRTQAPSEPPPGTPFQDFFRRFLEPGAPVPGAEEPMISLGSGFLIDPAGYIVTNNHVVADAQSIAVTIQDGRRFQATMVGHDDKTDLALLKIQADRALPALRFGDSDRVRVGDWMLAVGNPFGLGGTVSMGIISGRGRDIHAGPYDDFLQIDAAINRGNSGGPTFDVNGQVIGITSAIFSPNGGSVGIGFAIPANLAKPIIDQLRAHGAVSRGWLGVQIQTVTPELADSLGMPQPKGALIANVSAGSPAERAGLLPGDVVVGFDGKPVDAMKDLTRRIAETPGDTIHNLDVLRGAERRTIAVRIDLAPVTVPALPVAMPVLAALPQPGDLPTKDFRGLKLAALDARARARFGIDSPAKGVLVAGMDVGAADRVAVQPGDIILEVAGEAVSVPADLTKKITGAEKDGRKAVILRVKRRGVDQYVPFALK